MWPMPIHGQMDEDLDLSIKEEATHAAFHGNWKYSWDLQEVEMWRRRFSHEGR